MNKLSILTLLAAAAVAGCSSTGTATPEPEPEPFPESVREDLAAGMEGAVVYSDGLVVESGATGRLQMDEGGNLMTFEIDGTTYAMAMSRSSQPVTLPAWESPGNFQGHSFSGAASTGAVILGQYTALGVAIDSLSNSYALQTGLQTPAGGLPEQAAEYEGGWAVGIIGGSGTIGGAFEAEADFDAGTIAFAITDDSGSTAMGNGAGTISGNTFASSFNIAAGADSSINTAEGNFYGPAAEEMAGLIVGTAAGWDTIGYMYGHQK